MQELVVKQETSLRLTPLLEQSFKILQLDQINLQRYLEEMALENPLIEPELGFSQLELPADQYRARRPSRGARDDMKLSFTIEDLPDTREQGGLLRYISFQINIAFSGEERELIEYLAGFLDENGYLKPDFETICRESAYSIGELRHALTCLQSLDPPGIGASNLGECLLLQLGAGEAIEKELVTSHLNQLAFGNRQMLSKELGISQNRLQQALERIRSLNPRPGVNFSGDFQPQYIIPDISVTWNCQGELEVALVGIRQSLKPVESYMDMLRQTEDQDLRRYLNKKWEQLSYLQNCLDKRDKTILRLGETIAVYQERFFRYGPSALSSFCMKDAAEVMGVHKSTVSRAVSGKYLACDFGTFPLKYFFIRSFHSQDPHISSLDVKQQISRLIREEDSSAPLSDEELAVMLSRRGLDIARRTVAKYRTSLGIPNSSARGRKGFSNI